ncbi:MAG TPA: TlpA disulfide reductase family protein [Parasegetibacter sp.]
MRSYLVLLLLIANYCAVAQNEKYAKIFGTLETCPEGTKVILTEPYTFVMDTVEVKNGKFEFNVPLGLGPSIYAVQVGFNVEDPNTYFITYLDEGELIVSGKGPDFRNVSFTGSRWVAEWQEAISIVGQNSPDAVKFNQLWRQYEKAMLIGDEDAAEAAKKEGLALEKKIEAKIIEWVYSHPNSPISAYLITCYIKSPNKRKAMLKEMGEGCADSRIARRYLYPGKYEPRPAKVTVGGPEIPQDAPVSPGHAAPEFSAPDLNGKTVSLSDFKGKYVFIDFWASWCAPCINQIPDLLQINEKFRKKNFVMLAVSLDVTKEAWSKSVAKHKLNNMVHVSNLKGWSDPIAVSYDIKAIPANVLIGPDGKVVAKNIGKKDLESTLSNLLK